MLQLIRNPYAFLYLYYFLIRPVLKHVSIIWARRTAKHRLQLKRIQHKLQRIQFRFIAYRIWACKSSLDPDADLGHYLTWNPKNSCKPLFSFARLFTNKYHQSHPFFNLSILMQQHVPLEHQMVFRLSSYSFLFNIVEPFSI